MKSEKDKADKLRKKGKGSKRYQNNGKEKMTRERSMITRKQWKKVTDGEEKKKNREKRDERGKAKFRRNKEKWKRKDGK